MNTPESKSFREASEEKELTLAQEISRMLKHNKKYWMIPMLIILVLVSVIVILGANPATAPFIYSLF
jgi:hypothetical protein